MYKKNAWNNEYEIVEREIKVKDEDGKTTKQTVSIREKIRSGLKQDYDVYRKWEKAINTIKVEKPYVDPTFGVLWGTKKDKMLSKPLS